MEHLGTCLQSACERGKSHRHDHEFLQVDIIVGMSTPVQDIHHGDWQGRPRSPPQFCEILIERDTGLLGTRPSIGHRHSQDRVRS
ncbi:MAG: hypothetical protein ACD_62C00605G0001, partial [uncultured bacterium]